MQNCRDIFSVVQMNILNIGQFQKENKRNQHGSIKCE